MEFNLERDLSFFDVEATGLHVIRDRIIQIAIKKFFKNGDPPDTYISYINPGIPISEEAMEITGITPAMLRNKPTFAQVAQDIFDFIGDSDLAGYNCIRFDIPILMEEFNRAGFDFEIKHRKTIDVQRIFNRMEPRNLRAAYRYYCNSNFSDAHDAMADVNATIDVLKGQITKYKDQDLNDDKETIEKPVRNDMNALHDFTNDQKVIDVTQRLKYNKQGQIIFNFGRYNGKPVIETLRQDNDYYHWILKKDFSVQVKKLVKQLMSEAKNQT
jgi:DNA polymerase-3 subunit epsilon